MLGRSGELEILVGTASCCQIMTKITSKEETPRVEERVKIFNYSLPGVLTSLLSGTYSGTQVSVDWESYSN